MGKRKHRKVKSAPPGWKGCKCPAKATKVSTCTKTEDGARVCKGRGWGCLGEGKSKTGKPMRRFVKAVCPAPATTKMLPPPRDAGVAPMLPAGPSAGGRGGRLEQAIQRSLDK